jgi:trk system potassium uptake protein TrkA
VLVVGLGRFGSALAGELDALGHEVLAIDEREPVVQANAHLVAHAVSGDATDPETLVSLGVADMTHAVVAIGNNIEASILCTAAIADLGVANIWAKALTEQHARILQRVGATKVVFPERDMGIRVAHQVTGQIIDYIQIDDDFALAETRAPAAEVGKTLEEAQLRARFEITVVSVKPEDGSFTHATAETVLGSGDLLLIIGPKAAVERFAAST